MFKERLHKEDKINGAELAYIRESAPEKSQEEHQNNSYEKYIKASGDAHSYENVRDGLHRTHSYEKDTEGSGSIYSYEKNIEGSGDAHSYEKDLGEDGLHHSYEKDSGDARLHHSYEKNGDEKHLKSSGLKKHCFKHRPKRGFVDRLKLIFSALGSAIASIVPIICIAIIISVSVLALAGLALNIGFADIKEIDDEIREREIEKEQIIQRIQEINASIDIQEEAINEINVKITNVNDQITSLDKEIEKLGTDIRKTDQEKKAKEAEVLEYQEELKEMQDLLNNRLRVMYKAGAVGYLEVLFGADSMQELLSRADLLQRIVKNDQDLIVKVNKQKDLTEQKRQELAEKQELLEYLLNQRVEKKEQHQALLDDLYVLSLEAEQDKAALEEQIYLEMLAQEEIERIIDQLELSKQAYVGGNMVWPVPSSYYITSPYGERPDLTYLGAPYFHYGMDIAADYGADILAAQSGIVITAADLGSYGNTVIIDHGGQIATLYAHMSVIYVWPGQEVEAGQVIGAAGATGLTTGPHLHFEVRVDGQHTDPMEYVGFYLD